MKKLLITYMLLLFGVTAFANEPTLVGHTAERDTTLQQQGHIAAEDYRFKEGDTIIINKQQTNYLTGENIANWAYYVRHMIQQVGGKRFPNGILLAGINSWLEPHGLLLMGAREKTDTSTVKENTDRPLILERLLELNDMDEGMQATIQKLAEQHHMTAMVDEAREEAKRYSEFVVQQERERELRDSIAAVEAQQRALQDSLAAQQALARHYKDSIEAAQLAREKAFKDSLSAVEQAYQQALKDSLEAARAKLQFNRVGAGLRVGVASLMQKTLPEANGKWKAGFDILADAQYAHYWRQRDSQLAYGVMTGVSFGYTRNGVTANGNREFDVTDEDGDQLHYTITGADAKENDGTVVFEIPAMFSMLIMDQIFVNVGPRISIPVYSHYNQDLTATHIDAWNVTKNVHVADEIITGKVTDDMLRQKASTRLSRLNIQLSAEVGYEYKLPNGHILGGGIYTNYSVFSLYPNDPTGKNLISITTPSDEAPSVVTVSPTTEAFVQKNGLGFFDFGLKVIYHFMMW
ncbi:MAG: cell envelope integrity protein TolA [Paludibacteraceae bacterium]|nr:cell envelope integrity protein TolA [Paludibacteraceae bacterium]